MKTALRPEIIPVTKRFPRWCLDSGTNSQSLLELQQQQGLSYLFISHDLAVIQRLADRVAIHA